MRDGVKRGSRSVLARLYATVKTEPGRATALGVGAQSLALGELASSFDLVAAEACVCIGLLCKRRKITIEAIGVDREVVPIETLCEKELLCLIFFRPCLRIHIGT